jgi:hypothetical protein
MSFRFNTLLFLLAGLAAPGMAHGQVDLKTGLVVYLPFAGDARDQSGNKHNGKVVDAVPAPDRFGRENEAYRFNGKSSFIELEKSLPDLDAFTISTWVYNTGGSRVGTLFMDATNAKGNDLLLDLTASTIGVRADKNGATLDYEYKRNSDQTAAVSGLYIDESNWHHIVWTMNGKQSRIYLNGTLISTIDEPGSNVGAHAARPVIGAWSHGDASRMRTFKGVLDEFCVYNRALSAEEAKALAGVGENLLDTRVDLALAGKLLAFPNPNDGTFRLDLGDVGEPTAVTVIGPTGRSVYAAPLGPGDGNREIRLPNAPKGVYFLLVNTGKGVLSQRIVVR